MRQLVLRMRKVRALQPDNLVTGQRARSLRIGLSKSLKEMAALMGISFQHLSGLELGQRQWTSKMVDKFNTAIRKGKYGSAE